MQDQESSWPGLDRPTTTKERISNLLGTESDESQTDQYPHSGYRAEYDGGSSNYEQKVESLATDGTITPPDVYGTVADDLGTPELAEDERMPNRSNYDRTDEETAYDSSGTVADDLGTPELTEDERMPSRTNYDRTNQFPGDSSGTLADDLGTPELAEDERMPSRSNYDRTNQFPGDSSGTVADDLGTPELAEDERMPNRRSYDRTEGDY